LQIKCYNILIYWIHTGLSAQRQTVNAEAFEMLFSILVNLVKLWLQIKLTYWLLKLNGQI